MASRVVLVNGLPGSGKTSLATSLAAAIPAPLVTKDAIKEAVADLVSAAPSAALGRAAMDMAWSLTASIAGLVVLESWWFKPRDLSFVEVGLARCGNPAVIELWCDVPADLARERYAARQRHPIHQDWHQLADWWSRWADEAEPLAVGPVITVRTDRPVDIADLVAAVTTTFADGALGHIGAGRERGNVQAMSVFDIEIASLAGQPGELGRLRGKPALIVNVASKCGLTPQYTGLERIAEEYPALTVIGVPCNQFGGQEPGSAEEIAEFCSTTYGVTFPMTEKVEVNGDDRHPLYAALVDTADAEGHSGDIRWNFEKFLVDADGAVVARFSPRVAPEAPELIAAIEKLTTTQP